MMRKLFYLLPFLAVTAAGSTEKGPGKIVGGDLVDISKVKYQASLYEFGLHACGGSLVSKRHVLTAGHCITENTTIYTLRVRLGSSDSTKGGDLVHVLDITKHPNFNLYGMTNDAAILTLDREPYFHKFPIGIVELASFLPYDGEMLYVSGWGAIKEKASGRNQYLRGVWVPKVNQQVCKKLHENFREVTEAMICAGFEKGGKDACQGDSGGPLVTDGVQVGIVSWGEGCGRAKSPGVYTNIVHIYSWIKRIINQKIVF